MSFRSLLERSRFVWVPAFLVAATWLTVVLRDTGVQSPIESFLFHLVIPALGVALVLAFSLEMARPVLVTRTRDRTVALTAYLILASPFVFLVMVMLYYSFVSTEGLSIDLSNPGSSVPYFVALMIPLAVFIGLAGTLILIARGTRRSAIVFLLVFGMGVLLSLVAEIFILAATGVLLWVLYRIFRPLRPTAAIVSQAPPVPPYALGSGMAPEGTTKPLKRHP